MSNRSSGSGEEVGSWNRIGPEVSSNKTSGFPPDHPQSMVSSCTIYTASKRQVWWVWRQQAQRSPMSQDKDRVTQGWGIFIQAVNPPCYSVFPWGFLLGGKSQLASWCHEIRLSGYWADNRLIPVRQIKTSAPSRQITSKHTCTRMLCLL